MFLYIILRFLRLCLFLFFFFFFVFFFNDTATTEIYTLSLHDALPISISCTWRRYSSRAAWAEGGQVEKILSPRSLAASIGSSPVAGSPRFDSTRGNLHATPALALADWSVRFMAPGRSDWAPGCGNGTATS